MFEVGDRSRQPVVHGRLRFEERHSVHADVLDILPGIPVVLEHTLDPTDRPSPATYPDNGEMSGGQENAQARHADVR